MLDIKDIESSIIESMNVIEDDKFKKILEVIANKVSNTLVKTLGPYAHTTTIHDGINGYPTKDGWNVLKRIFFNDPLYQVVFLFITQISRKLNDRVGDGTTTALVAACHFIQTLNNEELAKFRQKEIIEALEHIAQLFEANLQNEKYIRKIDSEGDFSEIYKIAELSTNGNKKVAGIIHDIYKVTKNPQIHVAIDQCVDVEYAITNGFKLDARLINHEAYSNTDDGSYFDDSTLFIAIFEHNVTFARHGNLISTLSRYASSMQKALVLVAPNFDDTFLRVMGDKMKSLIQQGQIPNLLFVQLPMNTNNHKFYVQDLCIITDSIAFDMDRMNDMSILLDAGKELGTYELERLDSLKELYRSEVAEVAASENIAVEAMDPIKVNGIIGMAILQQNIGTISQISLNDKYMTCAVDKEKKTYVTHLAKVTAEFERVKKVNTQASEYSKEYMDTYLRYSKLYGQMGFIKVGGDSDLAKLCLKDAVDDAVLACRAAYETGYVRGMNITSMTVLTDMLESGVLNAAETGITKTLIEVYKSTTHDIFSNKGEVDEYEFHEILRTCMVEDKCFNLVTEEFEDFGIEGFNINHVSVINPAKTDLEVLKAIVSILSLLITSNQLISTTTLIGLKPTRAQLEREEMERKVKTTAGIFAELLPEIKGLFQILAGSSAIPSNLLQGVNGNPPKAVLDEWDRIRSQEYKEV